MSKITVLNEKALTIEVPKGAAGFSVWEATMSLRGYKKGDIFFGWVKDGESYNELIPKGEYIILGRPEEITEEQWKGIVDQQRGGGMFRHYDIEGSSLAQYGSYMLNTATESGLSLLKSKGLNPETSLILIKQ